MHPSACIVKDLKKLSEVVTAVILAEEKYSKRAQSIQVYETNHTDLPVFINLLAKHQE